MATVQDVADACMSEEALGLMDCFDGSLARIVREVSKQFAHHEGSYITLDGQRMVSVEKSHVRLAGELIFGALKKMSESGELPPQLATFDITKQCFDWKSH